MRKRLLWILPMVPRSRLLKFLYNTAFQFQRLQENEKTKGRGGLLYCLFRFFA